MKLEPEDIFNHSIAIALALFLSACGAEIDFIDADSLERKRGQPSHVYARTDTRVLHYVQEFQLDCSRHGQGTRCGGAMGAGEKIIVLPVLEATDQGELALGYCRKRDRWDERASWSIEIAEEVLDDPALAKAVVYHELGHCVLGLDHDAHGDNPIMSAAALPGSADDEADILSLFSAGG